MKKYSHVALGLFIAEQFKKAGVKIAPMCAEMVRQNCLYKGYKRGDVRLSHFTRLLNHFYDCHTKRNFGPKQLNGSTNYVNYRENTGDGKRNLIS